MSNALVISISGVSGVFIGMALLYVAILITPIFTKWFEQKKDKA